MANEAILVFETHNALPFTVSDSAAITKGSLCAITDPMTAAVTTGAIDNFAGIAQSDKILSDGTTKLGIYRKGVFRVYASGSVTVGDPCGTDSVANFVKSLKGQAAAAVSGSRIIGIALQTVTTGQQFLMELGIVPGVGN